MKPVHSDAVNVPKTHTAGNRRKLRTWCNKYRDAVCMITISVNKQLSSPKKFD